MGQILGHLDLVRFSVDLLNRYKINYLLTGSFAVSYYGYPRATHDIDFIVEISKQNSKKVLEVSKEFGNSFVIDSYQIREAIIHSSEFNILHKETGIKMDFWIVENNGFEKNKFKRKKVVLFDGQKVNIISAEDIILTKLLWCKEVRSERHLRDCVGILKIQKNNLDTNYLNLWAKKLRVEDLLKEISTQDYF